MCSRVPVAIRCFHHQDPAVYRAPASSTSLQSIPLSPEASSRLKMQSLAQASFLERRETSVTNISSRLKWTPTQRSGSTPTCCLPAAAADNQSGCRCVQIVAAISLAPLTYFTCKLHRKKNRTGVTAGTTFVEKAEILQRVSRQLFSVTAARDTL
jgi:hypothetical protein